MFERFTDRARQVVTRAQEEARAHNHDYIETEHILLGVLGAGETMAGKVLESLDISPEAIRQQVEEAIRRGRQVPSGHIPFTPRAKKVLEMSLREALQLGHKHIGTEHILLGLIREGEGVAAQVLVGLGADLEKVRRHTIRIEPDGRMLAEQVRRAMAFAEDEARERNHNDIGTEHVLLGLMREGEGVAAKALAALGITLEAVRQQVEEIISQGQQPSSARTPTNPE